MACFTKITFGFAQQVEELWLAFYEHSAQRKEMGFLNCAPVLVVEKGTFVSCL